MANKRKEEHFDLLTGNSENLLNGSAQLHAPEELEAKRATRRRRIYRTCVIVISVIAAIFIFAKGVMRINEELTLELVVRETDITDFDDAVYTASYVSSHLSATVSVTVVSGRMTDISLDSYAGIDPQRADHVFERVIFYQMLNVPEDDIGTQPTDKIVLKAIEEALSGAKL